MTDQNLSDILERAGERIPAGSPPLTAMLDGADRLRRRRRTRWSGAVAVAGIGAVVAVVVGGPTLFPSADSRTPPGPVTQDASPVESAEPVPPGTRLVGIGHAAIAVPEQWATNALRCGEGKTATVVVDVTSINLCLWLAPKVHDVVWVERGVNSAMFVPSKDFEIDGVPARANDTTCTQSGDQPERCTGTVFVPSAQASFRAIAATSQRVDEILSWIRVFEDEVAVPGFRGTNDSSQKDDAGEHYRAGLESAGLSIEVVTVSRPGMPAGYVLDVSPAPGTMLEPGQTVTMTEVAEPRGPGDEVNVEVSSVGPGDSMDYHGRTDAQLRAGTRIELDLGSTIWVYGYGTWIDSLAGEVSGPALAPDDWKEGPNYGRSWKAVARGTSELTVTITTDGERIVIGTVMVVVR